MKQDPYTVLGVSPHSTFEEVKSAFRSLVKKYHPDKGGDSQKILAINAAWETLKNSKNSISPQRQYSGFENKNRNKYSSDQKQIKKEKSHSANIDQEISSWIKNVYRPIDSLMGEVINSFPKALKELSADPYDDKLMDSFCFYIKKSQKKLSKAEDLYSSVRAPIATKSFALGLYQCFSEIQDGLNELERYTFGYVDNYLHDGQEMLRNAKKKRLLLREEKKQLPMD